MSENNEKVIPISTGKELSVVTGEEKKPGISLDIDKEELDIIREFRFPAYNEIPDVGLYLEQTGKYINEFLRPLIKTDLTGSMISNYVKKKIIDSPEKKQYYRDHIVDLIFIAISKPVLSLESVGTLLEAVKEVEDRRSMYESFCAIFEETLKKTFGMRDKYQIKEDSAEKTVMRYISSAVSYKIFLDRCFEKKCNHVPDSTKEA